MKGKIIQVQIFNDATTLYMCFGVDCDDICYFVCLEGGDFAPKYIAMTKDQFKNQKNKKDNYKLIYAPYTNVEAHKILSLINEDFKKYS